MSKKPPKVSIILPTHNGSHYIHQSVESCLNQTYANIELIVINDGSTDDTEKIIDAFADERIHQTILPKNQGIVSALNLGFLKSTGDFLTWTSDDNYYALNAIEVMLKVLTEKKDVDFVYSNYHMIDEENKALRAGHVEEPEGLDEDNYIGGCFLYRRKVYEEIGDFNFEAFLAEDYDYWLRVRAKFPMKRLEDFLYYYRMHDTSLTSKYGLDKVQDQVEKIREVYIAPWKQNFLCGKRCFYKKEFQRARGFLLKALLAKPFYYQTWRLLIKGILRK